MQLVLPEPNQAEGLCLCGTSSSEQSEAKSDPCGLEIKEEGDILAGKYFAREKH